MQRILLFAPVPTLSIIMRTIFSSFPLIAFLCAFTNGKISSKRQEPTLYLFGDSTMSLCRSGQGAEFAFGTSGWGTILASWISIPVVNYAKSGYSSRQAYREKIYDTALSTAKAGDIAIIQWGRNDVRGLQEQTLHKRPCDPINNNFDTVCKGPSSLEPQYFTFVKYLELAAKAFQAKGVHVIITSLTTKSTFQDPSGQFKAEDSIFVEWAKQAAELSESSYIDMHTSMTTWYQRLGATEVKKCYLPSTFGSKPDYTHTTLKGAKVATRSFIAALGHSNIALKSFVKNKPTESIKPNCSS